MARLVHVPVILLLATLLLAPLVVAEEPLELYPAPKTEVARTVQGLFNATFAIAMVVFLGVEGFLFYTLWKFRKNKTVPANEEHRGHTKAEIAWTVVPAAILLVLGTVSAAELFTIDTVPAKTDFTVTVLGERFDWRFIYPDENGTPYASGFDTKLVADWCNARLHNNTTTCTINELRVEEGKTVALDIISRDVEHQFFIPAFALKISAIPGRINHQWFIAPAPGDYHVECTMYCGTGHHNMGAATEDTHVRVFAAGSQPLPYGVPPKAAAPPTNATAGP